MRSPISKHIATGRTRKTTEVDNYTEEYTTNRSVTFATDTLTVRTTNSSEVLNARISRSVQSTPYSTLQHIATDRARKTTEVDDSDSKRKTKPSVTLTTDITTVRTTHSSDAQNKDISKSAQSTPYSTLLNTYKLLLGVTYMGLEGRQITDFQLKICDPSRYKVWLNCKIELHSPLRVQFPSSSDSFGCQAHHQLSTACTPSVSRLVVDPARSQGSATSPIQGFSADEYKNAMNYSVI